MSHLNTVQAMMEAMEEMDVTSPVSRSVTCENSIFVCLFVCCFFVYGCICIPYNDTNALGSNLITQVQFR